jgi:hypothetical protein
MQVSRPAGFGVQNKISPLDRREQPSHHFAPTETMSEKNQPSGSSRTSQKMLTTNSAQLGY